MALLLKLFAEAGKHSAQAKFRPRPPTAAGAKCDRVVRRRTKDLCTQLIGDWQTDLDLALRRYMLNPAVPASSLRERNDVGYAVQRAQGVPELILEQQGRSQTGIVVDPMIEFAQLCLAWIDGLKIVEGCVDGDSRFNCLRRYFVRGLGASAHPWCD